MKVIRLILAVGFSVVCLLASDDPFIGKWKLNPEKSGLTGQSIRIEVLPNNKYVFTEGASADEILADGFDHMTHFGETMCVHQNSPVSWSITYKKDGRTTMSTLWTVSGDGQQLTYVATGTRHNGQPFKNILTARRVGETPGVAEASGLAGTWQSTAVKLSSPERIEIRRYGRGGHTFIFPVTKSSVSMKFDGKDYPEIGPNVQEGYASSGRRVDFRTLDVVEKIGGKIIERSQITVSPDGNTQTLTVSEPGEKTPCRLVYDREPNS